MNINPQETCRKSDMNINTSTDFLWQTKSINFLLPYLILQICYLYITCSLIYVNTHNIYLVGKRGRHLTLGGTWQLPTLCRDSRCHLHNRERVRNQRTPQGRLSGVVFRETRWQGCNVVCGEDWRTRTNLFLSAAELVHPGLHECILVCVFWHLLHIEYQNLSVFYKL